MNTIAIERSSVVDIFSSIQGEGLYVGQRHIFVRFKDCNLNCPFCDEKHDMSRSLTYDEIIEDINRLEAIDGPHSYVSLTGGEPLCNINFLKPLCNELSKNNFKILLETNGTLFNDLKSIIHYISVVSMDIKLKSVWKINDCYDLHREFLSVLKSKNFYVKIIVSDEVDKKEFIRYIDLLSYFDNNVPTIIQPLMTSDINQRGEILPFIFEMQKIALKKLTNVRIIPQIHKIFNIK